MKHLLKLKIALLIYAGLFTLKSDSKSFNVNSTHSYVSVGGNYTSNLVISTGQIAVVTSNITMSQGTKITVERGAILICIGKTIGSTSNRFVGIEVLGNPNVNQNYENSIYCNGKFNSCAPFNSTEVNTCFGTFIHGILYFEGSNLINSDYGIQNGTIGGTSQTNHNGYLVIKNSQFSGNVRSVTIINSNTSSHIFQGIVQSNQFFFSENDNTCENLTAFKDFIRLENYINLKNNIKNNTFTLGDIEGTNRSVGINSYQTGFRAEFNTFTNLHFGVLNSSTRPQTLAKISINQNIFNQCLAPIYNEAPDKIEIFNNSFILVDKNEHPFALEMGDINGRLTSVPSGGIFNLGNTLFDISQNNFQTTTGARTAFSGIYCTTNNSTNGICQLTGNIVKNCELGFRFDDKNYQVKMFCNTFLKTSKCDVYLNPKGIFAQLQGIYGNSVWSVNNSYSRNVISGKSTFDIFSDNTSGSSLGYYYYSPNSKDNPTSINSNVSSTMSKQGRNYTQVSDPNFTHCQWQQRFYFKDECGNYINNGGGGTYNRLLNSLYTQYAITNSTRESIEVGGVIEDEEDQYREVLAIYDFELGKLINMYSDAYLFNPDSSLYYLNSIKTLLDNHETRYSNYLKGGLYLEIKDFNEFNNVVTDLNNSAVDDDHTLANYLTLLMQYDTTSNKTTWKTNNFSSLKALADTMRDSTSLVSWKVLAWVQQLVDDDTLNEFHGTTYFTIEDNPDVDLEDDSTGNNGPQFTSTAVPNPFTTSLTINSQNLKNTSRNLTVKVFDLQNNIIDSEVLSLIAYGSDNTIFDSSLWENGIYYVVISEGSDELNYHVVVK